MNTSFIDIINQNQFKLDNQTFPFRNTALKFLGTDNETLWKKNKNNSLLDYYHKNEITYKLNNFGYRTPYNFKRGDEVNVFLGCSHTIGYGIELEKTWPFLLNKEIGGNLVNLAIGGCSIDRQFREFYSWMNYFKIKNIFHFQPIYAREEFLTDKKYYKFSVQDPPIEVSDNVKEEFLIDTFASDIHIMRKYVTNVLAIESLSHRFGCNYYYIEELPEHDKNSIPARDNMHMDVNGHGIIYNKFLEKYKKGDSTKSIIDNDLNVKQNIL